MDVPNIILRLKDAPRPSWCAWALGYDTADWFVPVNATPRKDTTMTTTTSGPQRKLLWSANTAFGGIEYRARQNGDEVLLQSRTATGNWQTVDRVTVDEWHQRAANHDIHNPAFVAHYVDALADSRA